MITDPPMSDGIIYLEKIEEESDILPIRMEDIYMIQVTFFYNRNLGLELDFWTYQKAPTAMCWMTRKYWNRFRKNLRGQGYAFVRGMYMKNYYIRVSHLVGVWVPREDRPADLGSAYFFHGGHGASCGIFERDEALKIQKLLYEK